MAGETVKARSGRGPIPVNELLNATVQFADALDAATKEGIIHGDIKPANLFITQGGQAEKSPHRTLPRRRLLVSRQHQVVVDSGDHGSVLTMWVVAVVGGAPCLLREDGLPWDISPDGATIVFTRSFGRRISAKSG